MPTDNRAYRQCYEAALTYLEHRLRTEAELRKHLAAGDEFDGETAALVIAKLKELSLVDDKAYSEALVRERSALGPKSRRMIIRELLQKGVDFAVAQQATEKVDDEGGAFKAGLKKSRLLKRTDQRDFFRRMSGFLGRRGYDADTVRSVTERLWQGHYDNPV